MFSGVNAWLMDSTATQPAEAQGDGGQGVQLRGEEGEGMGGEAEEDQSPHMQLLRMCSRLCLQNTTGILPLSSTPAATTLVQVTLRT